jgi:hypothetical protein
MKRLSGVLFAVGVLIVLAAVAAACGGDDSDKEAREYFEKITEISAKYGADVQTAQATYDAVVASGADDKEQVEAFRYVLKVSSESIRAEIADREAVDPPPKVEKAHLDLLAAARVVAKVYEDGLKNTSDAKTSQQLRQKLGAVDYGMRLEEAQNSAKQACTKYQALADEEGIQAKVC